MKKILVLGYMLIIALSCKAQGIVPVEQNYYYFKAGNGMPNGTYLKDINHLFDQYVGTWKGTYNNREYTFYITKHTDFRKTVTEDEILIRYLITNPDGSIVEDTRNIPDDGNYVISGDMFSKNADYYKMIYSGREYNCGQSGTLFVRPKPNNQMSITLVQTKLFVVEDEFKKDCPQGRAVQLMPMEGMILTKQ